MFNAYLINVSFLVSFIYLNQSAITTSKIIGVAMGIILLVFAIVYSILFMKAKMIKFGEFKNRFSMEFKGQVFYFVMVIERLITSGVFVLGLPIISNAAVAGILAIQLIFIIIFRPYKSNIRPILNMSIGILIQGIFLGTSLMG